MATNNSVNTPLSGTTGTGNFVGSTSPTLTTPKIDQINDTNNNQIIGFLPVASAVNTIQISNANAGGQCNINTAGSDANINLVLQPKGTGYLRYYTQATSNQITVNTGTSSVHETLFQFPNTSASRSVTFPDASGTIQLQQASPTVQKFTSGSGTYTTPAGVKYIVVQMAGAGGGGAGSSDNGSGGAGGTGGTTSFGSSLLTCTGGTGGTGGNPASGGAGGTATLNSPAYGMSFAGQAGGAAGARAALGINELSGLGGSTFFGGGGNYVTSSAAAVTGNTATVNTGSGGGGAANGNGVAVAFCGGGGGSGGYLTAFIASPSATYSYSIGTAGTAGTAGNNGAAGGAGAAGIIIVTEYYQ